MGAAAAVILGAAELEAGAALVRDLVAGSQESVPLGEVVEQLVRRLG